MRRPQTSQRGAALLIVLLLVATLSFVVMSISDRMILASSRAANTRVRAELLWRVFGAEALARSAIETALKSDGFKHTADNPFFGEALEVAMEGGGALIAFRDAAQCFNVNSLAKAQSGDTGPPPRLAELQRLLDAADLDDIEPARLAAAIADWIDTDNFETAQGAEDGYYTALPAPYRTAGGPIAELSELRAAAEIGPAQYRAARALLCALPGTAPAPININMIGAKAAPLIVALAGADISLAAAEAAIDNRPPGGYASIDQFWSDAAFAGKAIPDEAKARVTLKSQFIEAQAAIRFADQSLAVTLLFEIGDAGAPRLVSRRMGAIYP